MKKVLKDIIILAILIILIFTIAILIGFFVNIAASFFEKHLLIAISIFIITILQIARKI